MTYKKVNLYVEYNFYLKWFLLFPKQTRYIPSDKIIYLGLFIIKN